MCVDEANIVQPLPNNSLGEEHCCILVHAGHLCDKLRSFVLCQLEHNIFIKLSYYSVVSV